MTRKKAKKSKVSTKTSTKVSKVNRKTACLSENMENDFRAIPNKLPAQFSKELDGLKKQETKLQSSLLKMQKQQAVAKNKHAAISSKSKNNLTTAAKKQINAAKKALEMINDAAVKLSAQLNDIKQHGKILSQKQAKFSAICKHIASIDKEWERKNAKVDKAKIARPKKSRKNAQSTDEPTHTTASKNEPARADMTPETVEASSKK